MPNPGDAHDNFAVDLILSDGAPIVVVCPGNCVWPIGRWVSVAFGIEPEGAVSVFNCGDAVDYFLVLIVGVSGVLVDYYVAVGVVGVEGFWVYALNDD